jgi:VCBS repeat-containing protein
MAKIIAPTKWGVQSAGNVDEDAGYISYIVNRIGDVSSAATIDVATVNGSAKAGTDYAALNQTLSFAAGETSKVVKVAIVYDYRNELNETVKLNISNASTGAISHATAAAVIYDKPHAVAQWSVTSDGNVGEGSGYISYTVHREGDADHAASIKVATANGTGKAGSDYTALNQTVQFAAGETSKTILVAVNDDAIREKSETVKLAISQPSDGKIIIANAVATILDNDSNHVPVITSGNEFSIAETVDGAVYIRDPREVFTVKATDAEGDKITYGIKDAVSAWGLLGSGDDNGARWFSIDAHTGEIRFKDAPNYERVGPTDALIHDYTFIVTASDGKLTTEKTITIHVENIEEAPVITSGDSATVAENTTGVVYQARAYDPDDSPHGISGLNLKYSLSGTDADWFNIDAQTGAVSFKNAPDYEAIRDTYRHIAPDLLWDNTYDINVIASDGKLTTQKAVTVTVTNVDEAPVITSGDSATVAENTTGIVYQTQVTDPDLHPMGYVPFGAYTYSLSGTDADWFNIDAQTGAVSFKNAPNYEGLHLMPVTLENGDVLLPPPPPDLLWDNTYDINVIASDGKSTTQKAVTVTVTDVDEAPIIVSGDTATVAENTTGIVYRIQVADPDYTPMQAQPFVEYKYSLSGSDADWFNIDESGAVSFKNAPDYEGRGYWGSSYWDPISGMGTSDYIWHAGNTYDINVIAIDGKATTQKAVTVTVTDVDESGLILIDDPMFGSDPTTPPYIATNDALTAADVLYPQPVDDSGLLFRDPQPVDDSGLLFRDPQPVDDSGLLFRDPQPVDDSGLLFRDPQPVDDSGLLFRDPQPVDDSGFVPPPPPKLVDDSGIHQDPHLSVNDVLTAADVLYPQPVDDSGLLFSDPRPVCDFPIYNPPLPIDWDYPAPTVM